MKYPIGIQDFRELRQRGYVYVDKTEHIHDILKSGKYFFLSRPRRFGKSLLLSTMRELYAGSKDLFEGLWIEDRWDWEQTNPVIWLKFSSQGVRTLGLERALHRMIGEAAGELGVTLIEETYDLKFKELIAKAAGERRTVLLIDEYDKPIVDYLDDIPTAEANREILKNFYSVLKDSDPHLETVFITGVSAFSRVSIFSDLNNLKNLSLHRDAAILLGITPEEVEAYFKEELKAIAGKQHTKPEALLEKMQYWYNGYSWDGETSLYNPFSLLNYLDGAQFRNFWFETGTPTFLVKEMKKHRYFDVEATQVSQSKLSVFDFTRLDPITVLFQTGYLTIRDYSPEDNLYTLDYPNMEVRHSLEQNLLQDYLDYPVADPLARIVRLRDALRQKAIAETVNILNAVFASIPYDLWQKENEHFYHAILHLTFSLLGAYIQSEVHTAHGRCDALVQTDRYIYAFEFKLDQSAEAALKQIKEKGYLKPHLDSPKKKIAVGINFSTAEKAVADWEMEEIESA